MVQHVHGRSTLCRELLGEVYKAEKPWKMGEIFKGRNLRKTNMYKLLHFLTKNFPQKLVIGLIRNDKVICAKWELRKFLLHSFEDTHTLATVNCTKNPVPGPISIAHRRHCRYVFVVATMYIWYWIYSILFRSFIFIF